MNDEALTQEQVQTLQQQLLDLRDGVQELLEQGAASHDVVELDQQAFGRVSRQDALLQQSMAKASAQQAQEHLRKITRALARIQSGDYGFCTECDTAIPYARLNALPESSFCLECQKSQ